jgi:hypothetical protein
MLDILRRQVLATLPSMLLSSLQWRGATAFNTKAIIYRPFHDVDSFYGCIFAKTGSLSSAACEGSLPASSIDYWTFRVSEIEADDLPPNIGRVVVWDDVFFRRGLCRQVGKIVEAIRRCYHFDAAMSSNTFGFHLENCSEIGPVITSVLPNISLLSSSLRIALIDIESFGISRLDWPDILPHLRGHYDLVVGFAHFPGGGPKDGRVMFGEDVDHSDTWSAVAHCDLSFMTTDALLGFDQMLDCEVRQPHLNAMLQRLIRALSTVDFLHTVTAEAGTPFLCIGALPLQSSANSFGSEAIERHRRILSSEFSDEDPELPIVFAKQDKRGAPLINEGLSLWPLRAASAA